MTRTESRLTRLVRTLSDRHDMDGNDASAMLRCPTIGQYPRIEKVPCATGPEYYAAKIWESQGIGLGTSGREAAEALRELFAGC